MLRFFHWLIKHWRLTLAFFVGALAALFFIGFTHLSFNLTGTNEFCGKCHEMLPQVRTWKMSSHVANGAGFAADCVDCHLPPRGVEHYVYKAWSGLRDVWVHYIGDPEKVDWEAKRYLKEDYLFEKACVECHKDPTPPGMGRGGFLAHRAWLRKRIDKKCWDCHVDLVHHNQPSIYTTDPKRTPAKTLDSFFDAEEGDEP